MRIKVAILFYLKIQASASAPLTLCLHGLLIWEMLPSIWGDYVWENIKTVFQFPTDWIWVQNRSPEVIQIGRAGIIVACNIWRFWLTVGRVRELGKGIWKNIGFARGAWQKPMCLECAIALNHKQTMWRETHMHIYTAPEQGVWSNKYWHTTKAYAANHSQMSKYNTIDYPNLSIVSQYIFDELLS